MSDFDTLWLLPKRELLHDVATSLVEQDGNHLLLQI